jgi:hypothetical protein
VERFGLVRDTKYRFSLKFKLEVFKGGLSFCRPVLWCILLEQLVQRLALIRKTTDKFVIEVAESNKGSQLFESVGSWPISYLTLTGSIEICPSSMINLRKSVHVMLNTHFSGLRYRLLSRSF